MVSLLRLVQPLPNVSNVLKIHRTLVYYLAKFLYDILCILCVYNANVFGPMAPSCAAPYLLYSFWLLCLCHCSQPNQRLPSLHLILGHHIYSDPSILSCIWSNILNREVSSSRHPTHFSYTLLVTLN